MPQTPLQQATEPVLRRIARDAKQASEPVKAILRDVADKYLEPSFGVDALARDRGSDWRKCHAAFAAELDLEPEDYLTEARLETALRLLEATALDPDTVGGLAGFDGLAAFRRASNLYLELPPSRLRELFRHRRAAAASGRPLPPPLPPGERDRLAGRFAEQMWKGLEALPFDRAQEYLRHETLLGEPHLFELLSRQSLRQGGRDPRRGVEPPSWALATVEGSTPILGPRASALRALALARLGGARRRNGDRGGAGEALGAAEAAWTDDGGPNPRVAAELWLQHGRLALAEGRRDDAGEHLDQCLPIARTLGVDVEQAEAWSGRIAGGDRRGRPGRKPENRLRQSLRRLERDLVRYRPPENR